MNLPVSRFLIARNNIRYVNSRGLLLISGFVLLLSQWEEQKRPRTAVCISLSSLTGLENLFQVSHWTASAFLLSSRNINCSSFFLFFIACPDRNKAGTTLCLLVLSCFSCHWPNLRQCDGQLRVPCFSAFTCGITAPWGKAYWANPQWSSLQERGRLEFVFLLLRYSLMAVQKGCGSLEVLKARLGGALISPELVRDDPACGRDETGRTLRTFPTQLFCDPMKNLVWPCEQWLTSHRTGWEAFTGEKFDQLAMQLVGHLLQIYFHLITAQ